MAALLDQRPRRQGQVGALPQRVPPDGHQGAAARRQRVGRPTSPPSAPTSGSAWPRSATSAPTSSTAIVAAREDKGRFASFKDFLSKVPGGGLQQAHHRVADQGRRVRRPAAHPPGPGAGARGLRRRLRRHQAQGGHRPGLALRRVRRRRRRRRLGRLRGAAADPDGRVGQADAAGVRARDARALRLRPPALRHRARPVPARRHLDRHPDRRREQARRHQRHGRGADHRPADQADQEGRPVGDRHGRGPRRARSSACSSPPPT